MADHATLLQPFMNEIMNSHRLTIAWRRIALVLLTLCLMQVTYWGEKIPLQDGAGWDGQLYREFVMHFDTMLINAEIDAYHMHRILPFAISHLAMHLSGLPSTPANAMTVSIVMNQLVVILCMLVLFRIADRRQWRAETELIAFSSIFFSVSVLKMWGYYPFLTDPLTLLLSLLACLHYVERKHWWLFVDGLLAMLTWPMLSLVVLLLLMFPMPVASADQYIQEPCPVFRRLMAAYYPLMFLLFVVYKQHTHPGIAFSEMFTMRPMSGIVLTVVAVLTTGAFYWLVTRWITPNWRHLLRLLLQRKSLLRIVIAFVAFVAVYKLMEWNSAPARFSVAQQFGQMAQLPASDWLIFLESPFVYLGPFFLLIVSLWPSVCRRVSHNETIGLLFVVLLALLFVVDIETRKHLSFFPFLLLLVMDNLNEMHLRRWVAPLFAVCSLFMSAFWLTINADGMQQALSSYSMDQYLRFPAQRYFMFYGPWQSHQVYVVGLFALFVVLFAIGFLHRKHLIVTEE